MRRFTLGLILALGLAGPAVGQTPWPLIAPTPATSDVSDRIATTQWVINFFNTGIPLASGKIFIGSAGGIATAQAPSGDCTLAASGVITCSQAAGNFNVIGNLTVGGSVIDGNGLLMTNIVAPATPSAGTTRVYIDSSTKVLTFKNDAGTVGNAVVPSTCGANTYGASISASGIFGCLGFGSLAPTPTRTGDIMYWNGSAWVTLPGNNSGTQVLQENSSGVASWAAGGGVSSVTCGTVAITSSGTCVFPYFSASLSANQSTTNGANNTIIANTVLADSNSWYNNATGEFTPQLAGKYRARGWVQGSGTSVTEIDCYLTKNGTAIAQALTLASGVATSCAIQKTLSFNGSTDKIVFQAAVTGTGTLVYTGKGAGTFDRTWFEVEWVGP